GSAVLIQGCATTPVDEITMEPVPVVMPGSAGEKPVVPVVFQAPVVSPRGVSRKSWSEEGRVYVVKKGDALSGIAQRHGVSVSDIVALNKVGDPDRIRAGQRLVLPGRASSGVSAPVVNVKAKPVKRTAGEGGYIVKSGDSLSGIAVTHGTTVAELKAANGIKGDLIYAGKELVIPRRNRKPDVEKFVLPVVDGRVDRKDKVSATDDLLDELPPQPVRSIRKAPETVSVRMRKITVQKNEDLKIIASRWATSVEELRRINGLGDASVTEGQILNIPLKY
ncbi:MAG: LysM peptidoglycan-binding domain-containing protein, partial [Kiritimatiellae bacterium]|nr:LysM peptidoglycan-binding domain-containing protein [Kiritimatiellia bacterium]